MADIMKFPNTMKEFIDSFSFKDSEEIYTNGAELIPVFRVEQGLEHYAKEIRAKALDDFVNFANTMPTVEEEDGTIRPMWLEEMAEKLKAGTKNDL